ncbi:efflux RND transporter periplasmic adaptor subunit [Arenibacter sp. S6351L]|uniref:efflux RND transporter periplasmic adaptor subunit n=1 Tax=Arenibacter sp. S6351L TaxID=2926407 RepID=UPI001FF66D57|nr:efflux RND transporter periplasmic adaptor subunit [Arenibacter sp. S6351L]MCK0133311.1 efflux RND transporter periplasmic adaptor subunit [Arenibacter sp. S6351L]
MQTKLYIAALITLVITISSCGSDDKKIVADNSPAVAVEVSTVSEENGSPFLSASGKIEAVNSANISTRMMGYVDKIYVQVGDKVSKGQQLISINNADISAKLAQVNAGITEATAAFTNAEKDYKRYTALFNENSASQKELDDITANYNMAKARLEGAKQMKNEVNAQFSYSNIRAPFNGVVTNKFIKVGDMANPGMPLMEVESPGNFQVLAMVPESEILQIKSGSEVEVLIKTLNESFKGTVDEVSTSAKNTGGQYMVKVILDESKSNLLSGMYATVQFPTAKKANTNRVLIPIEAVVHNGQLSGVYTVSESNTALLRWLRLGRTYGDSVEVLSGLSAEEQYIISAEGKLFNGAKISIQ